MNNPLVLLLMTAAGLYIGWLWLTDARAATQPGNATPSAQAFPGATAAPPRAHAMAVAGALLLLALETYLESRLGLAAAQSRMTWLMALYSIAAAPLIEELIFRGWIVVDAAGQSPRAPLPTWLGAVGASLVFAAIHPFLWRWDDAGFAWTFGAKGWFSTSAIFATSVWFYAARFGAWNPTRSLAPCFAAHAARNLGVVAVKAATGFMGGLW